MSASPVDLPSPEAVAALSRAGLRALLASPEVVQALAGAGLLQGAVSLPLREQRALIEALRQPQADTLSTPEPEPAPSPTSKIIGDPEDDDSEGEPEPGKVVIPFG